MTLANKNTDGIKYEIAGHKEPSKNTAKRQLLKVANELGTLSLLWLVVKRHKVVLLSVGNIVLVLNWVMPSWTEIVKSII